MSQPADTVQQEFLDLYGREAWLDWQRLLAHFDLGEGFSFLVLLLPGAVGADICRRHLAGQLAAKGKRLAELPCDWQKDARSVTERLFALPVTDDLGGIWLGSVIPESDPEISQWKDAWRLGLASLNQQRNVFLRRFLHCPLVLVGSPWLNPLLREAAPDLWSVRAAVVIVTTVPELMSTERSFAGDKRQMTQLESSIATARLDETTTDPDYALERAERLRGLAGTEIARARFLLRAGNGFYEHARFESAERSLREAADLFGKLADKPPEILSDWAGTLNNLANVLTELGRREEALAKAEEAVRIYAQLVAEAEEAVRIPEQRAGAQALLDASLAALATSLSNLANRLSYLGRREEALAKSEEALRIYTQLAQARPDTFLLDLAISLNNLATMLSDLGRREEALAKAEEAVRINAQQAHKQPDAVLPDLAMSLSNLANRLSDLGRREEALAKAEEAARIYAQLARTRPDAYLPAKAAALNNLGARLSALGRRQEALAKAEEAVRIYTELAQTLPETFLPNLAASLTNLANSLGALGLREKALAKVDEAVRIYHQLARAMPDAFLPNLARAFGARGAILQGMEKNVQAADSVAQGIQALTPLVQKAPQALEQLIGGLSQHYIQACESAKTEPDQSLLAPVMEVLEKLKQNESKS